MSVYFREQRVILILNNLTWCLASYTKYELGMQAIIVELCSCNAKLIKSTIRPKWILN